MVLARLFGRRPQIDNAGFSRPDAAHLRRCFLAGLFRLSEDQRVLILTPEGVEELRWF